MNKPALFSTDNLLWIRQAKANNTNYSGTLSYKCLCVAGKGKKKKTLCKKRRHLSLILPDTAPVTWAPETISRTNFEWKRIMLYFLLGKTCVFYSFAVYCPLVTLVNFIFLIKRWDGWGSFISSSIFIEINDGGKWVFARTETCLLIDRSVSTRKEPRLSEVFPVSGDLL